MAEHEVRPRAAPVNFAPATVAEEVLQNVATILGTVIYTVPYDRDFGINPEYLDGPIQLAQARATADIISAIRRDEPRAMIAGVTFEGEPGEGLMRPVVRVNVHG